MLTKVLWVTVYRSDCCLELENLFGSVVISRGRRRFNIMENRWTSNDEARLIYRILIEFKPPVCYLEICYSGCVIGVVVSLGYHVICILTLTIGAIHESQSPILSDPALIAYVWSSDGLGGVGEAARPGCTLLLPLQSAVPRNDRYANAFYISSLTLLQDISSRLSLSYFLFLSYCKGPQLGQLFSSAV